MQIQIISLTTALERRKHIHNEFEKQGISFSFFDALTPNVAVPLAEKMKLNIHCDRIAKGELACFMSHVSLWKKMVDENIPYMAIFEDDIFLGEKASDFLNSSDWIDGRWGIIKLEAFSKKVITVKKIKKLANSRVLYSLKSAHVGAAGYILSLSAAKYLINLLQKIEIIEPLDHILFDPKYHLEPVELIQMMPALCIQGYLYKLNDPTFGSSLEGQRVNRRILESKQRSFLSKILRELKRIYNQLSLLISNKKEMKFR